jgi:hypothetical protein
MSRLPTSHPCDSEGEAVRNYMQVGASYLFFPSSKRTHVYVNSLASVRLLHPHNLIQKNSDFEFTVNNGKTRDQSSSAKTTAFPKQSEVSATCPEGYR